MIAYRGPTLIKEPVLRWPIVLLAAAITALLAILTASLYYVVMTQAPVKSYLEPRLERALQPGQPEFEEFRRQIAIEDLVGLKRVFGCWHLKVSRPFTRGDETYQTCVSCGARRRFDLDQWTSVGGFYYPNRQSVLYGKALPQKSKIILGSGQYRER